MTATNLKVGKRYEVSVSDCCVGVEFVAKLEKILSDDDWPIELEFEGGIILRTLPSKGTIEEVS